jgi:hypothetical protein
MQLEKFMSQHNPPSGYPPVALFVFQAAVYKLGSPNIR